MEGRGVAYSSVHVVVRYSRPIWKYVMILITHVSCNFSFHALSIIIYIMYHLHRLNVFLLYFSCHFGRCFIYEFLCRRLARVFVQVLLSFLLLAAEGVSFLFFSCLFPSSAFSSFSALWHLSHSATFIAAVILPSFINVNLSVRKRRTSKCMLYYIHNLFTHV